MGEWERDEGQVGKEKQGKGRVGEKAGDDHNWGNPACDFISFF